jgi:transcriptional regulator with XRE-family HTH domain
MARPEKTHPLYHWRQQNGRMPLQKLAGEVGCTQSHLSEIENGKNDPSLELAVKLSRATGIPVEKFSRERV